MKGDAIVIGSGFAGLSAGSFLAASGWKVTVLEKQSTPGGRARQLKADGFVFDMGPSWYWMPDVFERYFASFGKNVQDYYELVRLDPSYRVYWPDGYDDIPAGTEKIKELFESYEEGSSERLVKFLEEAAYKYRVGIQQLVYKPGLSIFEFANFDMLNGLIRLDVFTSLKSHVKKYFKDERIRQLLEFPVLFLGALPQDTPALYSLMNYADIEGGTWYPKGGMFNIADAMCKLAGELGVAFRFNEEVTSLSVASNEITEISTSKGKYNAEVVISAADYNYVEQHLVPSEYRSYSESYWDSRELSPSCLLYYVGVNKKLKNIQHHNLFFDAPFDQHAQEIYKSQAWPKNPLFYVCASSVTDSSVAPEGYENLFFLIPVAPGLQGDNEALREDYFNLVLSRFEKCTGESIRNNIVYRSSFGPTDFISEYHSFRGNAYGLANTLSQTAILKPRCRSRKLKNLYYAGQLTVPGPGVPPSLISGEVVAGVVNSNKKVAV